MKRTDLEMITSRLTTKAQTTIPQPVRSAPGLKPGNELVYQIDGSRVVVTKAAHVAADYPFTQFAEWNGEADRRAYAKL